MKTTRDFPESCKKSIKTLAERLHTDYETAYAILCMEAILWDLRPSDEAIVEMVLASETDNSGNTEN